MNNYQKIENIEQFQGKNLLSGILPTGTRDDCSKPFTVRMASNAIDNEGYLPFLTDCGAGILRHLDIDGAAFTLVYDANIALTVDYIVFAAYCGGGGAYAPTGIKVYATDNKEDLFADKSLVADFSEQEILKANEDNTRIAFKIDVQGKYRYFALRQTGTKDTEPVSRWTLFGAFNNDFDKNGKLEQSTNNLLFDIVPTVSGLKSGLAYMLTDGITNYIDGAVTLENAEITFNFKDQRLIDSICIFAREISNVYIDTGLGYNKADYAVKETESKLKKCSINLTANKSDFLKIKLDGKAVIEQISAYQSNITLKADFAAEPICDHFYGLGANVIPTHLFESSLFQGYNEAYLQLEGRRVDVAKPAIARLWFQVDWFVMDEDGYINRKYVFNSPKMQAFFKDLQKLKDADVEVELDYGWKTSINAQSWFSFPNVFNRRASAPKDLEHFATSCADCVKELIVNRGFTNIKYLNFYNESNGGVPNGWDFLCPEGYDIKAYWVKMLKTVYNQFKKDGLLDLVDFWASEVSTGPNTFHLDNTAGREWFTYFKENADDYFKCATFHQYQATYEQAKKDGLIARECSGKPVLVTEFADYDTTALAKSGHLPFDKNNIATLLGYMNAGIAGLTFWILSGSDVSEGMWHNGEICAWWQSPVEKCKEDTASVNIPFYQFSLVTNYIPRRSKIYTLDNMGNNVHTIAAVTENGDYTVCVESDSSSIDKTISLDFGKNIGKTFYKHVFDYDFVPEGNAIIPPCVKEIKVTDKLEDGIGKKYSFVVYTTIKPREQVVLDKVYVRVKPGESVKLNAKTIDGNSKIKWSMVDCHTSTGYRGTITEDGVYTADSTFYSNFGTFGQGAVFAAKAEAESGEYAICIIEIKM